MVVEKEITADPLPNVLMLLQKTYLVSNEPTFVYCGTGLTHGRTQRVIGAKPPHILATRPLPSAMSSERTYNPTTTS